MPPKRKGTGKVGRPSKKAKADVGKETLASSAGVKKPSDRRKKATTKAPPTRKQPARLAKGTAPDVPEDPGDREDAAAEDEEGDEVVAEEGVAGAAEGAGPDERVDGEGVVARAHEVADRAQVAADAAEGAANRVDAAAIRIEAAVNRFILARPDPAHTPVRVERDEPVRPSFSPITPPAALPDNGWPDVDVLGQAYHRTQCKYKGKDATLEVVLQVYSDPDGFKSRLGYRAKMKLILPFVIDPLQIGYIHAWRINKPTQFHRSPRVYGGPSYNPWTAELLKPDISATDRRTRNTALCMQALYDDDGNIRPDLKHLKEELLTESLLFIDTIYIFEQFQRQGFLQIVMPEFDSLLIELPEWLCFKGTVVLLPAAPTDGPRGWGKTPQREVQERIRRIFQGLNFIDYVRDGRISLNKAEAVKVDVMGKSLYTENTSIGGDESDRGDEDGD